MADLNFIPGYSYTAEQFKSVQKVDSIVAGRKAGSSKCFFTYGTKTGAVSEKLVASNFKNATISLVHPTKVTIPTAEELKAVGTLSRGADGKFVANPQANGYFFLMHCAGEIGPSEILAEF